jgi:hypothetical protein
LLGRPCGGPGSFEGSLFLVVGSFRQNSYFLDNLRKRRVIVIDICCMCKKDVETIFFFIVMWLLLYGVFLAASGCLGLCLDGLSTCLRVGGPLEGQGVLRCGKWCPLAFFGLF